MPQLVKGGKWVFGWVIISPQKTFRIPPQAFEEYGFRAGEPVVFLRGSRRSGGFSIGQREKLVKKFSQLQSRVLAQIDVGAEGQIEVPPGISIIPGDRLLAVRGSGLALSFLNNGPIYKEALQHPEVETFLEME
jgi:hypothetical protein